MQSMQKIAIKKIPLENIIDLLLNFDIPPLSTQYLLDQFDNYTPYISKEYFTNLYLQINNSNKSNKFNNQILERMIEIMDCNKIYLDLE
jgi:hypothetical protein